MNSMLDSTTTWDDMLSGVRSEGGLGSFGNFLNDGFDLKLAAVDFFKLESEHLFYRATPYYCR
jgi:hypothetical protein